MNTRMTMKTPASLLAIGVLAFVAAGCASSGGKSKVRVTEEKQYIRLNHVQDTSQLALKKGDALAMICSECKTVWYQSPASAASPFFYPPPLRGGIAGGPSGWQQQKWAFHDWERRHYCPGCKSSITTTGTWKEKKETIKHTCDNCGSDSVFCCASTREGQPTEGMQSKQ